MNQNVIELPTKPKKAKTVNPRRMFIFSHTKVGKTTALAQLPNSLLIDVEDGSHFVDGMTVNIREKAKELGKTMLETLKIVADQLKSMEHRYDYIILDTSTGLEAIAKDLAAIMYRGSNMGKNWKGGDITQLPSGAGYLWLRRAYEQIYKSFDGLAKYCFILSGHVKTASINKEGKELSARDINLTGKLKQMICMDMDAIGYMFRNKGTNENILSFKTNEQDLVTGARPHHLRGQEFVISTFDPKTETLTTYWDKIFI